MGIKEAEVTDMTNSFLKKKKKQIFIAEKNARETGRFLGSPQVSSRREGSRTRLRSWAICVDGGGGVRAAQLELVRASRSAPPLQRLASGLARAGAGPGVRKCG